MTDIDERAFRNAMGNFCTGVVIATGAQDGIPAGFAAQSFVSLSLDPPLVMFALRNESTTLPGQELFELAEAQGQRQLLHQYPDRRTEVGLRSDGAAGG